MPRLTSLAEYHLKNLRAAGFTDEASFFEAHVLSLGERYERAHTDAGLARAERDQWMYRCASLKRRYGVRTADQPREHNEATTYTYEVDGVAP